MSKHDLNFSFLKGVLISLNPLNKVSEFIKILIIVFYYRLLGDTDKKLPCSL